MYIYNETLKHLCTDSERPNCHLLIEPHLLYLTDNQADAYLDVVKSNDYSKIVHNPVTNIISDHLDEITEEIKDDVSLIELGPGYPDSSLLIAKHCYEKGVNLFYYPVDISKEYLSIATKAMSPYVVESTPIHSTFEEASLIIPKKAYSRKVYVLIGQTFLNFLPEVLLPLLCKLASVKGIVILAADLLTNKDLITETLQAYKDRSNAIFTRAPLINLGIKSTLDNYCVEFYRSRIECYHRCDKTIKLPPEENKSFITIRKNDKIITAVSYRYKIECLKDILKQYFVESSFLYSKKREVVIAINKT